MFKRLRVLSILGCVAILVTAYLRVNVLLKAATGTEALETGIVDRDDIVVAVSATGPIRARQETPLSFAGIGTVSAINVTEGDHVLKGQTLAILDTKGLSNAIQAAQLALDLQKVAYNALLTPPREVDQKAADAALKTAQAQLAAAQMGADSLQIQLAQLQVEIAKNAAWQTQLGRDASVAQADARAALNQQITDLLSRLPANVGDQVSGFIATLPTFSGMPSPSAAEAQVRTKDFDVKIAESNLAQIRAQGGSDANIAAAQLAIITAQTAIDKLKNGADAQTRAIAETQIKAAQAALDLARYNLTRANLTAPYAGVVAKINLTAGEPVPQDRPAITMLDDSSFYVDVPVDETDISKAAVGQPATLIFDSLPGQVIKGSVSRIAVTSITVSGVVTYPVRVQVEAPQGITLRAGMSTTATITVSEVKNVVRVRNRFVRLDRKTGRATVIVQEAAGRRREVEVTLGLKGDTYSEVKSGLSVGDLVVLLPRDFKLF